MKIRPKFLAILIISSFLSLLMTNCGAAEPNTALGFAFWVSFGVFTFCIIHLTKNEEYYKKYMDEP